MAVVFVLFGLDTKKPKKSSRHGETPVLCGLRFGDSVACNTQILKALIFRQGELVFISKIEMAKKRRWEIFFLQDHKAFVHPFCVSKISVLIRVYLWPKKIASANSSCNFSLKYNCVHHSFVLIRVDSSFFVAVSPQGFGGKSSVSICAACDYLTLPGFFFTNSSQPFTPFGIFPSGELHWK